MNSSWVMILIISHDATDSVGDVDRCWTVGIGRCSSDSIGRCSSLGVERHQCELPKLRALNFEISLLKFFFLNHLPEIIIYDGIHVVLPCFISFTLDEGLLPLNRVSCLNHMCLQLFHLCTQSFKLFVQLGVDSICVGFSDKFLFVKINGFSDRFLFYFFKILNIILLMFTFLVCSASHHHRKKDSPSYSCSSSPFSFVRLSGICVDHVYEFLVV